MARRVGISTIQQASQGSLSHDDSFSKSSAHRQRPQELDQLDELEAGKEGDVPTNHGGATTTKSRRPSFGKMNDNLQQWLKEQKRSQASCRSLPFTATFYVVFVMTQLAHRKVQTVYTMQTSMRDALVTGVVPAPMPLDVVRSGTTPLNEVTSWADLLNWMDQTMVPFMWNTGDGGPGIVMEMNRLIGGARVQQQRLNIGDCPGPNRLADSYNTWITGSENSHCVGSELETSPIAGVQVAGSLLQGDVANDEGWYTYWLDASLNQTAILGHVDALRQAHWPALTAQTVRIQSALHCGQVGMFALIEVLVSMDRVGAITPLIKVKALPTQVYVTSRGALVGLGLVIGDATFFGMLVWLLLGELLSLRKKVSDMEGMSCCARILKRFFRFHTLITWAVIMFGMGFSAWSGWLVLVLEDFAKQVLEVVDLEGTQGSSELREMQLQVNSVYDRLVYLTDRMTYYELATFWYMLLMLMMFLRNFQANKRLAVITETLQLAMGDLIHFFIIFFLVFMNFVLGAYFLFGQSLKEWSKLSLAANTGFRALMGDFDFTVMYKIAPFNATVWFWSYMIFIFLIMINMALAIVMDAYAKVKENSRGAETIIGMVKRECKEKWVWVKGKLGRKNNDMDQDDEDDSDSEAGEPTSPTGDNGDAKLQELTGEVAEISKALVDLLAANGLNAPVRRDVHSANGTSRGVSQNHTLASLSEKDAASQYGRSRMASRERSYPASDAGTIGATASQATIKLGASRVSSTSTMNTASERPSRATSPKNNAVVVKAATESQRRNVQQSETMPAPAPQAGPGYLRRTAQQAETMPAPQPRVAAPQDVGRRPETVPGVPDHSLPRAEADEKVEAWAEMMSRYGVNMDPVRLGQMEWLSSPKKF